MPVVPVARNLVDLPNPGVNARVEAPNMGAGGEMIGRAAEGFGQSLNEAADAQNQIDTIHDHAAVKEQVNHVLQWYTGAAYTGPNAFFQQNGKDAVAGQPMITKGLDTVIAETRAGLNDERQRKMFDLAMIPQREEWGVSISKHAADQEDAYNDGESLALMANSAELAKSRYLNDPAGAEKNVDTGLAEISIYGARKGWSRDQIAAKQLEYTSGVYKDVGANLAYAGPDGPKLAQALADQHGDSMTADDRFAVTTHARVAQNMMDAEARRAEAEQRREAAEARHDAHDRATSAKANLDSGLPLDPKDYANAIADAQTANDEALVRGLQNGQLKNTTIFTHQKDTPPQLQQQINHLTAKISKDGAKADPNDIIQRDALQGLYGRTSEQLKTNGVSWAASTLGVDPQPLNIADGHSIAARVDLISTASRRAGQQLDPLQPSEITPLAQTWRTGDATAKAGMVMRLAQFGALAPAAAQQIAPNDNGLVHLIGLASHSNRGVAMSRVGQVMAGYDDMKTEGQLVGKTATEADFNHWVGGALQFMPGAKDGVFTVAKALLAHDASQHGWDMVNSPPDDKAWYRAINSALGAYTHNGVQLGGLAGYNGAQTILPENMSLDDFEGRIGRATDQSFKAAGNGVPALSNGTVLGAGDLKKMHFVPVDDGVYRLETGGAFVHTKDGHPFEIDVRKLNHPAVAPAGRAGGGTPFVATASRPAGMVAPGNIDLHHRPIAHNADGSISTVRSISIGTDAGEVLIPTVVGGKVVSNDEAVRHFKKTGEHLGIFKSVAAANAYAKTLHNQQAAEYDSTDFNQQLAAHGYTRY